MAIIGISCAARSDGAIVIKIKPIIPKRRMIDPKRQQQAIEQGMADAKDGALEDFKSTTSTWSHQPDFVAKQQKDGYLIGTNDDVWLMLNKGTRAHDIVAKKISLRFPGGPYRPKTRPGFIGSQSGGSSGAFVFRGKVHHPGTSPRGWSTIIAKKWRSRLAQMVQKRISEALR